MFCFQSISVFPIYWTSAPYPFIYLSPAPGMKKYPAQIVSTDETEVNSVKIYGGQNKLHKFLYILVASLFVDCTKRNLSKQTQFSLQIRVNFRMCYNFYLSALPRGPKKFLTGIQTHFR